MSRLGRLELVENAMKKKILALILLVGLTVPASATLMDPVKVWIGGANPTAEEAYLDGLNGDVDFLAKYEVPEGWDNPMSLNISVNVIDEASSGTVAWDLTGSGYEVHYVLVKNGEKRGTGQSLENGYMLFKVTDDQFVSSKGAQDICYEDSTKKAKGISHVTFYGVRVPDGGTTVALLGLGLLGIGAVQRRFRR